MHVPGLVLGMGLDLHLRVGQGFWEKPQGGGEHCRLEQIVLPADGGDHEPLAGITVFYFIKKAFHGLDVIRGGGFFARPSPRPPAVRPSGKVGLRLILLR